MGTVKTITMSTLMRGAAALFLLVALCAHTQAWAAMPPPGTLIVNTVTVDYSDGSGTAMPQETGSATVVATGPASLTVSVTGSPDPVYAGDTANFAVTVTNNGLAPLTGVGLATTIPANTTFVSADSGGTLSGGVVTWSIGGLGVGASVTVNLYVQVDTGALPGTVITDTATASSNETLDATASDSITVIARTQGVVRFTDSTGANVQTYTVGGTVYVEVSDFDQNADPLAPDTVTVVIVSYRLNPDGTESVIDTITITLTETGPDTGIFTGSVPTAPGAPDPSDGVLTVDTDTRLVVTYTDPLDPLPSMDDTAFIDPFGVVFDSVTGAPVSGAVVVLIDDFTGLPAVLPQPPAVPVPQTNTITTDATGSFQFQYLNPGTYHFDVTPGGTYTFPSTVPTPNLPPGFVIGTGSRGESFTIAAGMGAVNLDIPVDAPGGELDIMKVANTEAASVGDIVTYTIRITNNGTGPVGGVTVTDVMPHGVVYIDGTTKINGAPAADPAQGSGTSLVWNIGTVLPGTTVELTFQAVIGPDSPRGNGMNRAFAGGATGGGGAASNTATCTILISRGVFTDKGTIVGRVYVDANGDRMLQPDERGVQGVTIYMEDGTWVVTDPDGKYSIYGVGPGDHVLKVDQTTLPQGAKLHVWSNRSMGDAGSQFADMTPGLIFHADFPLDAVELPPAAQKSPAKPADTQAAPASPQDGGKGGADASPGTPGEPEDPYEELIKEMDPSLAILEPADGTMHDTSQINVTVKAHHETELTLYVNGVEVAGKHIGKKIKFAPTKTMVYRYYAVRLEPGVPNVIRAEMKDPFGNVRGTSEITVTTPGRPHTIEITPEDAEGIADGAGITELKVRVLDAGGNVLAKPGTVTVVATAGEIVNEDADAAEPGVQTMPEMGVVTVRLRAPRESGTSKLKALCGGLEGEAEVYFAPHLREMIAAGIGEAVLGYGNTSGSSNYLTRDGRFDEELYLWGRGAFFMKGDVGAGVLLTASYDSDKEKRDQEFFRERRNDVESEELYPIYGDESMLGNEAVSSRRLYVRADRGRSHVMYGDYETGLTDTRLTAFRRTLTGIKAELDAGAFKLKGFASETGHVQAVDRFQGRGVAGYYFLASSPVLAGSELVVIETRDRLQPERVLDRRTMSRWSDYHIDYDTGSLLFKEPISTVDDAFNPVYIIVSYESEGAERHYVYGGRVAADALGFITAGFTGVVEENAISDSRLLGVDLTLKLPLNTTMKAEWASTDSIFTVGGMFQPKRGDAWYVSLEGEPIDRLRFAGSFYDFAGYFNNPSAFDVVRGKRGYGAEVSYDITGDTHARAKFLQEEDKSNNMDHTYASAGVDTKFGDIRAGLEFIYERANDKFVPKTSPNARYPFDFSETTPDRLTAIKASVEARLTEKLVFDLEHTQDLDHSRFNMTQAGLEYRYSELTRFYVREQYATYDDSDQLRTVAGVESTVAKDTVAYSEYRLTGGAGGLRNQHGIGLRNKFNLGGGITGNASVENLKTVSGPVRQNEEDAFAASVGVEYLMREDVKSSARVEYRDSTSDVSRLAELGFTYKLNRDVALLVSGRYFDQKGVDSARRASMRGRVGLSYRPSWTDKVNALARAEYKHERGAGDVPGTQTDSWIFSAEGTYRPTAGLIAAAKYACKYATAGGTSAYTDLASVRVIYDLTDRIDLGAACRVMTDHRTGTSTLGGAAEVGYRLIKNVWVSAGYSFDRFDSDLAQDEYTGYGPYVKLRVKLDERLFGLR